MRNVLLIMLLALTANVNAQFIEIFSGAAHVITESSKPVGGFKDIAVYSSMDKTRIFVEFGWNERKFEFDPLEEMSRYTTNGSEKTIFRTKKGDAVLYITLDSNGSLVFVNFNVFDREGSYVDRIQWFPQCEEYLTNSTDKWPAAHPSPR